jgi:glc operon protein GlcG
MTTLLLAFVLFLSEAQSVELPSKKVLSLAAVKKMVAGAEAEAKKQNVEVTICVVDDAGTLIFLEKGDGLPSGTVMFAEKKARHAAAYGHPSKDGADAVKNGNTGVLVMPDFFPAQGGVPIIVDGKVLGGIAASGAKSEIDEAIAQAGVDALLRK